MKQFLPDMNTVDEIGKRLIAYALMLGPSDCSLNEDGVVSTFCGDGRVLVVEQFYNGRVEWSYTNGDGEITGDLSEAGKEGLDFVIADYLEGACR